MSDRDEVKNLIVVEGAARKPVGNLIMCDIPRSKANVVIDDLEELNVDDDGSVMIERIDVSVYRRSSQKRIAPEEDAVVWEEFAQRMAESSHLTWVFLAFLSIAMLIAGIGLLTNSVILIVGAMVLGPEFGPLAAICFGLLRRDLSGIGTAAWTLIVGYLLGMVVTYLATFAANGLGWISPSELSEESPSTYMIVSVSRMSFIVAILAGVAGILSVTSDKSTILVGVFISVTTVPAASYMAAASALKQWALMSDAALQLGLNLGGIIVAGTITLLILRIIFGRLGLHSRFRPGPIHR